MPSFEAIGLVAANCFLGAPGDSVHSPVLWTVGADGSGGTQQRRPALSSAADATALPPLAFAS